METGSKVKIFNEQWKTVLALLKCSCKKIVEHWAVFFIILPLAAALGTYALLPYDVKISDSFSQVKKEHRSRYNLMKKVSKYGDFGGVVVVCVLLVGAGKLCGRRRLAVAGIAGILAASAAGLLNDFIKLSGRPRPDARIEYKLEDKLYGPKLSNKHHWFDSHYQSFASGHTTTAFGAAAGIGLTVPVLAVPVFAGASLVAFSRVYIHDHYPTDVFAGAMIGLWFGLAFALAARDLNRISETSTINIKENISGKSIR